MSFFPQNTIFFDLLEELSTLVTSSGKLIPKLKIGSKDAQAIYKKAFNLEHEADEICHKLFHEADSNFITPIDREDIHILAGNLDTIIDHIENVASNVILYKVRKEPVLFKDFGAIIQKSTVAVDSLVHGLRSGSKGIKEMKKEIIHIHSLENEGDQLTRKAFESLFARNTNAIEIIKWKDIYENMEEIMDECENTADIVDQIIVKNF